MALAPPRRCRAGEELPTAHAPTHTHTHLPPPPHPCPCPRPGAPAGSQTLQGEAVGFETEATAIMDTMAYIRQTSTHWCAWLGLGGAGWGWVGLGGVWGWACVCVGVAGWCGWVGGAVDERERERDGDPPPCITPLPALRPLPPPTPHPPTPARRRSSARPLATAAMILASGKKGFRYALPNARIMTCPPRMNR